MVKATFFDLMLKIFPAYVNSEYVFIVKFKATLLEVKCRQTIRCMGKVLTEQRTKF